MAQIHRLESNMRLQVNDYEYSEWLIRIGNGEIPTDENGDIQVPERFLCDGCIEDAVFGDVFSRQSTELSELAILTPRNVDALRINEYVLDRLSGDRITFLSEDKAVVESPSDALNFPTEFLNRMTQAGMPPHALHLKIGCMALFHNHHQEELRDFELKAVFEKLNLDAADFQEWPKRMELLVYGNLLYSSYMERKIDFRFVISTPNNLLGEVWAKSLTMTLVTRAYRTPAKNEKWMSDS
ncbi:unnamed protein product [Heligmosomoides polygyrus]|uniref:ATP-dependent DNA helicase n=1 Tax=Heligmosomoides polygyrus TaxID=6339 RepID=A0A183GTL5_HELPZ|nr:unnamed protein product [Heligmosomoides polygyrus]